MPSLDPFVNLIIQVDSVHLQLLKL